MPPEPAGGPPPGDADRDRLAAALGRHYAAGRLELGDFEGRLGRALTAANAAEAAAALDGLGTLEEPAPRRGPRRRHRERDRPQPGWVPTLERFRDPGTDRVMRVWVDPVDRSRNYVAED